MPAGCLSSRSASMNSRGKTSHDLPWGALERTAYHHELRFDPLDAEARAMNNTGQQIFIRVGFVVGGRRSDLCDPRRT